MTAPRVAVASTAACTRARAQTLASSLDRPDLGDVTELASPEWDLLLVVTEDALELRDGRTPTKRGFRVDFRRMDLSPRGRSPRQPLGRAVGPPPRLVVDATAGFGTDAVRLAVMGFDVIAIERVAVARLLFEDGLARAWATIPEAAARITVRGGDAIRLLAEATWSPETIYLDPMYPPKRKPSALPPKPVRLLGRLAADAPGDAETLFEVARRHATDRVVVKRPHHAPPLAGRAPDWTVDSKLVRYDCYRTDPNATIP